MEVRCMLSQDGVIVFQHIYICDVTKCIKSANHAVNDLIDNSHF